MLRIGIDIGGTFTDFVTYDSDNEELTTFKILSDNNNPATTVLLGLSGIKNKSIECIVHGSTVATNALLERKGARTALITTKGFKDVLQIGRQNRQELYSLNPVGTAPLIPSELRLEVNERIDSEGHIITQLHLEELKALVEILGQSKVQSVAVCLLFSFLYPNHERIIAEYLEELGYFVSASSDIIPEYREYERTSTTVINAYVSPILDRYITDLQSSLPNTNLQLMQSNGGMINLDTAKKNGVQCILSGPAGGIVGAEKIAQLAFTEGNNKVDPEKIKIITFDMGGTSTDVSLINGKPILTTEAIVGGYPIHIPMLDIHTIGAGGGSLAYVDGGGILRVGPQSAGANPGPACYGNGELPTVTDANLILGRLLPDHFLGGRMKIFPERSFTACSRLSNTLNLNPIQIAFGIIDVVNIQMERALKVISVERGHDPRDFSLFSFGGAGGLHACDLARNLGIPRVIVSRYASTLSALGMLVSDVIKDYVQTVMLPMSTPHEQLDAIYSKIIRRGMRDLINQGVSDKSIEIKQSLDLRYRGQSYELNIPYSSHFVNDFHELHKFTYGYSYSDREVEFVNIRVRAIGQTSSIRLSNKRQATKNNNHPINETHKVHFKDGEISIQTYMYDHLAPGMEINGPALIISSDTTILANRGDVIRVDNQLNLLIEIKLDE